MLVAGGLQLEPALPGLELRLVELEARDQAAGQAPLLERQALLRGGGTRFGATLDATCDRITDGALFAAITWWLIFTYEAHPALIVASFVVLVSSQVISYVKARGEASGFTILGGLIERPERLIIGLVGIGLQGLGVPYAIDVAVWVLAAGSVWTVIQRLYTASRNPQALEHIAPPPGAEIR